MQEERSFVYFAVGMNEIAMGEFVSGVVTDNGMPIILIADLQLNAKTYHFAFENSMPVSSAAIRSQAHHKFFSFNINHRIKNIPYLFSWVNNNILKTSSPVDSYDRSSSPVEFYLGNIINKARTFLRNSAAFMARYWRESTPALLLSAKARIALVMALVALSHFGILGEDNGLIFFLMPCDWEYYRDELKRQRAREKEAQESEEKAKKIAEEIEKSVEEMGGLLDELVEAITEEESRDDLDTNITEAEEHDIRKVTIQAVVRYLKSASSNKNFEQAINLVAQALQKGVLTHDRLENVTKVINKDRVKEVLKKIYDRAGEEIKQIDENGNMPADATKHSRGLANLNKHLTNLTNKLGHHHHLFILGLTLGILAAVFSGTAESAPLPGLVLAFPLMMSAASPMETTGNTYAVLQGYASAVEPSRSASPIEASMDYIKLLTNDLDALAEQGELDKTYYIPTPAGAFNSQVANPDINNIIMVGDLVACQGLINAIVLKKKELSNLKRARFFEINTALFVDRLAVPAELESELGKLVNYIKTVYAQERVVLVLNFQAFDEVYKIKFDKMASLHLLLRGAINDRNISVVILANPKFYDDNLSKDKHLEEKFSVLDLRSIKQYDLLRIARDFMAGAAKRYEDLLPEGVKIAISKEVLEKALELSQKYYHQGFCVQKLQEVVDKVISRRLAKEELLNAGVNNIK